MSTRLYASLVVSFLFFGCNPAKNIKGTYQAYCTAYHVPQAQLTLNANRTFSYKFIYNEDKIEGAWTMSLDSLILRSDYFKVKTETDPQITPIRKLTDLPNDRDVYLIKGKKLYPVMKKGVETNCILIKTKKLVRLP